jgi:thiol-disulfide isomerase/thioredoxin
MVAVALAAAGAGALFNWRRLRLDPADTSGFWGRSFPAPDGGALALAPLKGRPLLVNFWATWCPPCVEELPLLSSFYDENKANGWQLLGLAVDRPAPVAQFLARSPVSFPVALAGMEGVELTRELGNAAGGLPFSVLFDAAGELRARKLGQLHATDLTSWQQLLSGA